jgi:predicted MFS family arabinose efflux permease
MAEPSETSGPQPDLRIFLTVLVLGGVLFTTSRTTLYPLLDQVALDLNLTSTQAGGLASAYFLMLILNQIPVGLWGDRLGFKRFLVGFFTLGGLALVGMIWAKSYPLALFFAAIQGLGLGVFWPASYSLTMLSVPRSQRGRASAIVSAGLSGGHALGLISAGMLFGLFGNWRTPFLVLAIPTLLLALVFQRVLHDVRSPSDAAQEGSRMTEVLAILRNRNFLAIYAASFTSLFGFFTLLVWGPSYLQAERGVGIVLSGVLTAIITIVAMPAGLVSGPLSDRIGRRRLSVVMFLLSTLMLLLLGTLRTPWALLAALVGYGLVGKFAWDPVQISWLADQASVRQPGAVGLVISLSSVIGMSASVLAPAIGGWIRDQTGTLQGAILLAAGLMLLGTLATFLVEKPAALEAGSSASLSSQ